MASNTRLLPIPMGSGGGDMSNYYTKSQVDALIADFITNTVDDLTNYYLKSETYTQAEVNSLVGQITSFEVVATLPVSDIKTNVIYLVGPIGTGADKYEEYIYSNSTWVKIGETSIDLSGYVTATDLATTLNSYVLSSNLATVATTGAYSDLSGTPTIPDDLNDFTDVNISSPTNGQVLKYNSTSQKWENGTGGGTDNTFELSGEAQSDLADLYLELTTNGRSLGPTTIENWLMDNRVTYYGYPIVSAFVGDYTVDNNGNLAPIEAPRSRDTKAPVQVNDTKVVFGYYPDVRVSGQTVGMKYVLLQSDGTLVTAVDTITITSGGGKNVVEMSTDDRVTSQQEWADLYDAIDEAPDAWFEANTLVINGYECDKWNYNYYILDDDGQVIYDQDEQEQVYAFWCCLEMWNDAKISNDTTNLSYVDYAVYLLHSDGAVDEGSDTLTLKPVVELSRIANGDNGYGEYIYNWIMDQSIEDFMTLNAVYYYGQPVTYCNIGKFTTDGDGHLVEDLSLQEDTVVFQLDTFVENGIVTTRYTLLFSDGTMEDADTVIDLTNSVTLNFTDSNNVTTSYTFYIHPGR